MEYPPDLDRAIEGVEKHLTEISIARATLNAEWEQYQALRNDFVYEKARRGYADRDTGGDPIQEKL